MNDYLNSWKSLYRIIKNILIWLLIVMAFDLGAELFYTHTDVFFFFFSVIISGSIIRLFYKHVEINNVKPNILNSRVNGILFWGMLTNILTYCFINKTLDFNLKLLGIFTNFGNYLVIVIFGAILISIGKLHELGKIKMFLACTIGVLIFFTSIVAGWSLIKTTISYSTLKIFVSCPNLFCKTINILSVVFSLGASFYFLLLTYFIFKRIGKTLKKTKCL